MKQHLLPQFYLRGFTDPETPPEHEPFVWVYSLKEQKWEKRSPKNVAVETDYYTYQDETDKKSDDVEEMLQKIESGAASVINNKIANRKPLSDDDRIVIATFIASTMMRVPGQHDHIGDFLSEIGKKFLAVTHHVYSQDPKQLEYFKEEYKKETGSNEMDILQPDDLDPSKLRIRASKLASMTLSFSTVSTLAQMLLNMGWIFDYSAPTDYFITSDYPLFFIDPKNKKSMFTHALGNKNIEVTFPITRNIAFYAHWNLHGIIGLDIPRRIVENINLRTVACATRFIIAPKPVLNDRMRGSGLDI